MRRLHLYRGFSKEVEKVPRDVTHVIVDDSVTIIKKDAFYWCKHLVSVIMGDNVKRIEDRAFYYCRALCFIRLSKTLEFIGERAFFRCQSLEALFLSLTVVSIKHQAFSGCRSLRLLVLPDDIDIYNSCKATGSSMCVYHDASSNSIMYQFDSIVEVGVLTWSFYVYFHYYDGTDDYATELSYFTGDY